MPKYNVAVARFPYGGFEHTRCVDWLVKTVLKLKADKRVGDVIPIVENDTPITMTRNAACLKARKQGADYLLMLDNDMAPDHEGTAPFWDSSWEFLLRHRDRPGMIAAPYCGPPPHENVYVFRWRNPANNHPDDPDFKLEQYTREEAAERIGIEEVAALPTGLLLMDIRALDAVAPPWFYYDYPDDYQAQKASTEDVVFTRNCSFAGVPVYCNWDSWAGHVKQRIVGKPRILTADMVTLKVKEARRKGKDSREKMVDFGEDFIAGRRSQCTPSSPTTRSRP
jgi:hypothetical protein